jgi:hypothetical protein
MLGNRPIASAPIAGSVAAAAGGSDALLANDVSSASSVGTPALGQVHGLLANDVASASSVGTPALGQVHALLANDVASASSVGVPAVGQIHALAANDVASASTVSNPVLAEFDGTHDLLADDVTSASSVSVPSLGQIHVLAANDVESASSVSNPALAEQATDVRRGDPDFGGRISRKERRARNRKARDQLQELLDSREEKPPAPTPRLIKRIQREIVAIAAGGLGVPQQQELARFVKREVVQAYQPDMEWAAITAAFQRLQQQAAEEAERLEIEDEDEFVLLMAA